MGALNNPPSAVRWGVWGTGKVARDVCRDMALVEGARLAALGSRSQERARAFARDIEPSLAKGAKEPRCHEGLPSLLADPEVDVVYVATPNHRHAADTILALSAGKAVLCEKPLTTSLSEARAVAEAAERAGVFCMEGLWSRFLPAVVHAREIVVSGGIGAVRMIQGSFGYSVIEDPESRLFRVDEGGGALLDRGVYLLSLAQYFLGAPEKIEGDLVLGETGVDLQASMLLRYGGGAQAMLTASLSAGLPNELILAGETGILTLHDPFYRPSELTHHATAATAARDLHRSPPGLRERIASSAGVQGLKRRLAPLERAVEIARTERFPFPGGGYQFEIAHVCEAIRGGQKTSPLLPLGDSLEVLRQMDRIRGLRPS